MARSTPSSNSSVRSEVSTLNKFDVVLDEGKTTIKLKGIGEVILNEANPQNELSDVKKSIFKKIGLEDEEFFGKLEHIEVSDSNRGKGYAKMLMEKAISYARENGLMPLYLNASPLSKNGLQLKELTKFYEKFGFKVFDKQVSNGVPTNNLMILKE